MKILTTSPTLFGIDLAQLGRHWKLALDAMASWPVFRWLTPRFNVRILDQGELDNTLVPDANGLGRLLALPSGTKVQSLDSLGYIVPVDVLLTQTLDIPHLLPDQLRSVVELELQRLSPFKADDQLYAWHLDTTESGEYSLQLLLTSRSLINKALPAFDSALHELWAPWPGTDRYINLPGFGENRRLRAQRRWRWINGSLVTSIVLMLAGLAVTPTLQLHLRAQEAKAALASSQQRAAPAVKAREDMLTQQQRVKALEDIVSHRLVPEHTLLLLTRYLPDDTYVINLDIRDRQIQLTGLTPNAAAFMAKLGAQPGVSKVTAVHAARRENSRPGSREIFTIEFLLDTSAAVASGSANEPAVGKGLTSQPSKS